MSNSFLFFIFLVYGLGVIFSQSLMALAGTLCVGYFLFLYFKNFKASNTLLAHSSFLLVLYLCANLLFREPNHFTIETLRSLPLFLIPSLALLVREPNNSPRPLWKGLLLIWVLGVSYLITTIYALYQLGVMSIPGSSFMKNPIYFAYTLLPAFVFFSEMGFRPKALWKVPKIFCFLIAFCIFVGILASLNRMTLACVFLYVLVRGIPYFMKHFGKGKTIFLALLFAVLSSLALYQSPVFQEKLVRTLKGNDPAIHWRLVAWKYNWNLFLENPVFGVGPERNAIDTAINTELAGEWAPKHKIFAHSIYFQMLAEVGIVGLILFSIYFYGLFSSGGVASKFIILSLLVSGLTENIFNNSRPRHAFFFYLLLALYMDKSEKGRTRPKD